MPRWAGLGCEQVKERVGEEHDVGLVADDILGLECMPPGDSI